MAKMILTKAMADALDWPVWSVDQIESLVKKMDTDKIVGVAQDRLKSHFGAFPIPWTQIIAILMQLLSGCFNPTPQSVRTQLQRPLVRVRLFRRLMAGGAPVGSISAIITAMEASLGESTDEELATFIQAAQESE